MIIAENYPLLGPAEDFEAMPPALKLQADAYGKGCDGCKPARLLYGALQTASVGVSAYHGYKRNNGSIGWAIGWALLGGLFPVIVPAIALGQGLGEEK